MATFAPISYTYVPTAPRVKSAATCRKPAPEQPSIFDKLQCNKPSCAAPNGPELLVLFVVDNNGG